MAQPVGTTAEETLASFEQALKLGRGTADCLRRLILELYEQMIRSNRFSKITDIDALC